MWPTCKRATIYSEAWAKSMGVSLSPSLPSSPLMSWIPTYENGHSEGEEGLSCKVHARYSSGPR